MNLCLHCGKGIGMGSFCSFDCERLHRGKPADAPPPEAGKQGICGCGDHTSNLPKCDTCQMLEARADAPHQTEAGTMHQQIMNLPLGYVGDLNEQELLIYKSGHRDARHAAAQFAAQAAPAGPTQRRLEIAERAYDRLSLCPDHRDKAAGRCVICDGEKRGKEESRGRIAALEAELQNARIGTTQWRVLQENMELKRELATLKAGPTRETLIEKVKKLTRFRAEAYMKEHEAGWAPHPRLVGDILGKWVRLDDVLAALTEQEDQK